MKPLFGFTVLLSCILLFACKKSHDSVQPPVTPPPSNLIFSKAYGGTDIENGGSIAVTSDGGFVLAGTTFSNNGDVSGNHGKSDVMIIRADSTGKKIWEKTIGG